MNDHAITYTQDCIVSELSDRVVIEAAFETWCREPRTGCWDVSDFTNSDACENARFHFEAWFEDWVLDSPDPFGIHQDGFSDEVWVRLHRLGTEFYEEVYDAIHNH